MARSQNRTSALALLMATVAAIFVAPVAEARAETVATPGGVATTGATTATDARISGEAHRLSGREVAVVCAAGASDWAERLAAALLPGPADEYYGFSFMRRSEMYLSPFVCDGLRLGMSAAGRRSNELQVAWSVNVLVHESVHLAESSTDEGMTEACARIALPSALNRLYRVAYNSAEMRRLTFAASWFRRTMPAEYQGGTCPTHARVGGLRRAAPDK